MPQGYYVQAQKLAYPYATKLLEGPYKSSLSAHDRIDHWRSVHPDCNVTVASVRRKRLPDLLDKPRRAAVLAFNDKCRLVLDRGTETGRTAGWLMCNPSTADAATDDPTAGRVQGHSLRWGYERQLVGNVWGWRTPQPSELWMALDDRLYTGEMHSANLDALTMIGAQSAIHVVAFGVAPGRMYPNETRAALDAFAMGAPLFCLGTSDDGWPLHPLARGKLAIPADVELQHWEWPE